MEEKLVCDICSEVIEYPKDKNQRAHDYCVYADDASKKFESLGKNNHKANALAGIKKLAFALSGLEVKEGEALSQDAARDAIIFNHNKLREILEGAFAVDLGENKTDIITRKIELLQPFFRLETVSKELGYNKPNTLLEIIPATYYQTRKKQIIPKSWDKTFIKHNISPSYIRTGKGEVFLTEHEKNVLTLSD